MTEKDREEMRALILDEMRARAICLQIDALASPGHDTLLNVCSTEIVGLWEKIFKLEKRILRLEQRPKI